MRELYRFHEANATLFTNVRSTGRVALVKGRIGEYRGLIKLLSEEHIIYDVLAPAAIGTDRMPRTLEDYDAVILGDVENMNDDLVRLVDDYVRAGGKLLATGFSSVRTAQASDPVEWWGPPAPRDPDGRIELQCLGVAPEYELFPQSQSTYLHIGDADRDAFGRDELRDFDLMMVYQDLMRLRPIAGPLA